MPEPNAQGTLEKMIIWMAAKFGVLKLHAVILTGRHSAWKGFDVIIYHLDRR